MVARYGATDLGDGPNTKPLVIAHRGAPLEAPENTMAAFRLAAARGADMLECDVQPTSDGTLVIMHDEDVRRTTDGRGPLRRLSLSEVRQLDAGSWFGPEFAGEAVPTLEEVCAFAAGRILLNLEVKCPDAEFAELVDPFLACLRRYDLLATSIISSFDLAVLTRLRRHSPDARLAYLHHAIWVLPMREELRLLKLTALHPHHALLTRRRLERAHSFGLAVNAWTVDNPRRMARLCAWQADGIITNDPGRLAALIRGGHPIPH